MMLSQVQQLILCNVVVSLTTAGTAGALGQSQSPVVPSSVRRLRTRGVAGTAGDLSFVAKTAFKIPTLDAEKAIRELYMPSVALILGGSDSLNLSSSFSMSMFHIMMPEQLSTPATFSMPAFSLSSVMSMPPPLTIGSSTSVAASNDITSAQDGDIESVSPTVAPTGKDESSSHRNESPTLVPDGRNPPGTQEPASSAPRVAGNNIDDTARDKGDSNMSPMEMGFMVSGAVVASISAAMMAGLWYTRRSSRATLLDDVSASGPAAV